MSDLVKDKPGVTVLLADDTPDETPDEMADKRTDEMTDEMADEMADEMTGENVQGAHRQALCPSCEVSGCPVFAK